MKQTDKILLGVLACAITLTFIACKDRFAGADYDPAPPPVCTEGLKTVETVPYEGAEQTEPEEQPETYEPRYTEDDVFIVAQMLQGECYQDNEPDQRSAAITVCNRVGYGEWAQWDTPAKIVKYTGFYGWCEYNVPSETNLRIAREVLDDWSAINAGYDRPWEPWLYFSSGGNGSNIYYEKWT